MGFASLCPGGTTLATKVISHRRTHHFVRNPPPASAGAPCWPESKRRPLDAIRPATIHGQHFPACPQRRPFAIATKSSRVRQSACAPLLPAYCATPVGGATDGIARWLSFQPFPAGPCRSVRVITAAAAAWADRVRGPHTQVARQAAQLRHRGGNPFPPPPLSFPNQDVRRGSGDPNTMFQKSLGIGRDEPRTSIFCLHIHSLKRSGIRAVCVVTGVHANVRKAATPGTKHQTACPLGSSAACSSRN